MFYEDRVWQVKEEKLDLVKQMKIDIKKWAQTYRSLVQIQTSQTDIIISNEN